MAKITFENIEFCEENDRVKLVFLKIFYTFISKEDLNKIGKFNVKKNTIEFFSQTEKAVNNKFYILLSNAFENLVNSLSNNKTVYVHKNSGIPLIGSIYFGLIDRNSSVIEVRPITSCNYNCIYCSVNEGVSSNKSNDFVVEKDYLVQELKSLIEYKGISDIEAHIGTQGEPLLYADLIPLIRDISSLKGVKVVSIDTNGSLLTEENIDELAKAGLTRINLSLNAIDPLIYKKMCGLNKDNSHILKIASYASKKLDLLIAPVWVPSINDSEIPKIIEFSKKVGAKIIGIQNFLNYKGGRNPVKQMEWTLFYEKLKEYEKKYNTKLILTKEDFNIRKTKKLVKPFEKDDIVSAKIVCNGRNKNEVIAVSKNRTITISNVKREKNDVVKVKLTRDKHNIFYGVLI